MGKGRQKDREGKREGDRKKQMMTETDKVRGRGRRTEKTGIQIETETTKDSEGGKTLGET